MNHKLFQTIGVGLLALGILGLVLGILIGMYRTDQLKGVQATAEFNETPQAGEMPGETTDATEGNTSEGSQDPGVMGKFGRFLLQQDSHIYFLVGGGGLTTAGILVLILTRRKNP